MTDKILGKEDIVAADDLRRQVVKIPEWGGSVIVRSMTGKERDQFEEFVLASEKRSYKGIRAKLIALTVIGEDGKSLFTVEEADVLGEKSARALDRIFAVAQKLAGYTKQDMDELTANLSAGQSADSISG